MNVTMKGKYVMFGGKENGLMFPVLMPDSFVEHKHIKCLGVTSEPVSAGFFSFDGNNVHVWGKSVSLKLESSEDDARIILNSFQQ